MEGIGFDIHGPSGRSGVCPNPFGMHQQYCILPPNLRSVGLSDGRDNFVDGFPEGGIVLLVALGRDGRKLSLQREEHPYRLSFRAEGAHTQRSAKKAQKRRARGD